MRAVAREHVGDRRADPARGAGDERDLAVQRPLPVERRRLATGSPIAHDLAGDVGRARREQEAQRRVELVLGAGLDVDELDGRAARAISLPSERVKPSSARWAVASRGSSTHRAGCRARSRGRTARRADRRVEEPRSSRRLGRVGDPGGVEDERLEALVGRRVRVPDRRRRGRPRRRRRAPRRRARSRRRRRRRRARARPRPASRPPGAAPSSTAPAITGSPGA